MADTVFIAMPTRGQVSAACLAWLDKIEAPHEFHFREGHLSVTSGRLALRSDFLKSDCTHLLFVDDDVAPYDDGAVERLLADDKDIVGGVYFMWSSKDKIGFPVPCTFRKAGQSYRPVVGAGVSAVDAMGAGFLLIRRAVLEHESMARSFRLELTPEGVLRKSDDFSFCEDAAKLGYQVWADYRVMCSHVKLMDVSFVGMKMMKAGLWRSQKVEKDAKANAEG